ncbi:hypothetical protein SAMN04487944_109168 [Gracilibacillus ureilyticus]|uniref:Uncharacterized protein n=1 Tax=Gracilibacillus ureilyticus TaxID=531814 RepID=A0A1H9RW26_9BACI|nr:hypothetical protein [Gracilibacillus ureilyticus]SER76363.1 hypothetical protein SAMN04487944_109168 [Gracilibacillus ureilyticus]
MSLEQKLAEWQEMQTAYLKKIRELVEGMKSSLQIVPYFTYSLQVSHHSHKENYILGTFHVQNVGHQAVNNPMICIKLTPPELFEFSGKYVYPDTKQPMQLANAWERMNEAANKEEFWLRPKKESIAPGETISFSNFQVKWLSDTTYNGSIQGFVYTDEMKEGLHAVNQIQINGTIVEEEDFYEEE